MPKRSPSTALRAEWLQSFARWLKARRKRAGLTQKAVAEAVSLSVYTVRKIEASARKLQKGEFVPSRELAADIGEFFDDEHAALLAAGYLPFVGWAGR